MFRVRFEFPSLSAENVAQKKPAMTYVLLRQVQDRIRSGGDEEYTFPPLDFARPDGSRGRPLYQNGKLLLDSMKPFVTEQNFGVSSNFIGARVQLRGTVGKGGTLPTIVPRNAKALYLPLSPAGQQATNGGRVMPTALKDLKRGKDYLFVKKVDIRPRKFFRLTAGNKKQLIETFIEA